jgi:hypothetical protein
VTCTQPTTTGYDFGSVSETLSGATFAATGITCATGYAGTAAAAVCAADGAYTVSGCEEIVCGVDQSVERVDDNFVCVDCPSGVVSKQTGDLVTGGVTYCNVDCAGTWSTCTSACENAAARVWTESAAQSGQGDACPYAIDCAAGEDACPLDIDCAGTWSACTVACEDAVARTWTESDAQSGQGAACPQASACQPADDECPATPGTCGEAFQDGLITCDDLEAPADNQVVRDNNGINCCIRVTCGMSDEWCSDIQNSAGNPDQGITDTSGSICCTPKTCSEFECNEFFQTPILGADNQAIMDAQGSNCCTNIETNIETNPNAPQPVGGHIVLDTDWSNAGAEDSPEREMFIRNFIEDLALSLNINPARIRIVGLGEGSIDIEFEIAQLEDKSSEEFEAADALQILIDRVDEPDTIYLARAPAIEFYIGTRPEKEDEYNSMYMLMMVAAFILSALILVYATSASDPYNYYYTFI